MHRPIPSSQSGSISSSSTRTGDLSCFLSPCVPLQQTQHPDWQALTPPLLLSSPNPNDTFILLRRPRRPSPRTATIRLSAYQFPRAPPFRPPLCATFEFSTAYRLPLLPAPRGSSPRNIGAYLSPSLPGSPACFSSPFSLLPFLDPPPKSLHGCLPPSFHQMVCVKALLLTAWLIPPHPPPPQCLILF